MIAGFLLLQCLANQLLGLLILTGTSAQQQAEGKKNDRRQSPRTIWRKRLFATRIARTDAGVRPRGAHKLFDESKSCRQNMFLHCCHSITLAAKVARFASCSPVKTLLKRVAPLSAKADRNGCPQSSPFGIIDIFGQADVIGSGVTVDFIATEPCSRRSPV
ncbi:MAG: hypothetical protein R3C59_13140 [Planctomycetaceae bacterium]